VTGGLSRRAGDSSVTRHDSTCLCDRSPTQSEPISVPSAASAGFAFAFESWDRQRIDDSLEPRRASKGSGEREAEGGFPCQPLETLRVTQAGRKQTSRRSNQLLKVSAPRAGISIFP